MSQHGSNTIGRAEDRQRLLADDGDDQMLDPNNHPVSSISSSQRINPFNSPPPQLPRSQASESEPAPQTAILGSSNGSREPMRMQMPRFSQPDGELEHIALDPPLPALVSTFKPLYSFIPALIFTLLLVLFST